MSREVCRFGQHPAKKAASFKFFQGQKLSDCGGAPDCLVEQATEATEAVAIGQQNKSILPPNKLTSHVQSWTVGVD